jgi:hypothetical protein
MLKKEPMAGMATLGVKPPLRWARLGRFDGFGRLVRRLVRRGGPKRGRDGSIGCPGQNGNWKQEWEREAVLRGGSELERMLVKVRGVVVG